MKKRGLYISIILGAMIAMLSGCGNSSTTAKNNKDKEEKITLTVTVSSGELGDEKLYEKYMEENPNIIIKEVPMGNSSSKLISMISSGESLDLIRHMGYDELPVMMQRGILAPLDDYLADSTTFNLDDCYDIVNVCRFDGKTRGQGQLYGIPKDWSPIGLWIDKSAFQEAGIPLPSTTEPMTWDEFATLAKKLVVMNNGAVDRHGCVTALTEPTLLEMYLNSYGDSLWTDDLNSTTLTTEKTREAMEYFMDLHKSAALGSSLYPPTDSVGLASLVAGKTAMALGGYWFRGYWERIGDLGKVEDRFMFVPAPVGTKNVCYVPDVTCIGLFSGSKHPEEAMKLLEYLVSAEQAITARTSIGYGLPLFKSYFDTLPYVTEFDKQALDLVTNYQFDTLDLSLKISPYISYSSMSVLFDKYYLPVLYERGDLKEGLKTINHEVELLIQEGKELVED